MFSNCLQYQSNVVQYSNVIDTAINTVNNNYRSNSSGDCYSYQLYNAYTEPEMGVSTSQYSQDSHSTLKDSDVEMESSSIQLSIPGYSHCSDDDTQQDQDDNINSKKTILQRNDYIYRTKIAKTLQGEIFEAINTNNNNQIVVIKKAMKCLVHDSITIRNGKRIKIEEDIWREIEIMKYLDSFENSNNNNNIPNTLPSEHIKLIEVLEDDDAVYIVTEHGGIDLFEWVSTAHKHIQTGQLSMSYWWKNVRFLFKQMVDYVLWLHETMAICHLDLSLENMLIQNGEYFYQTGKFTRSQQIKVCDFGLSEYFDVCVNPLFRCNKYVGKESYMAPEVYVKTKNFDARKADAWSLGVILFVMMAGAPAYTQPDLLRDRSFQFIVFGKIQLLLSSWKRLHYIDPMMLDLVQKIFVVNPQQRLTVQQIKDHPWLQ